jgi:hypothetical protein
MTTYLECELCRNKYKLKEGESIGNLRYLEIVDEEMKAPNTNERSTKIPEITSKKSKKNKYIPYLFGIAITLIPIFLLPPLLIITPILGSIIASYMIGGNYKNGVKNGVIIGFISSLLSLAGGISLFLVFLILFTILGALGGLIGIFIKNKIR